MAPIRPSRTARVLDYLSVLPQYAYPHHLLSRLIFRVTRIRYAPVRKHLIKWFVHHYQIALHDAADSDIEAYPDFNSFFTRALRPGARPLPADPDAIVSPVDGTISQFGQIADGYLLQAKGRKYRLKDLLGTRRSWSEALMGGSFFTIYLAPGDYHRVHMPTQGELLDMCYVPGRLFSVNEVTTRVVHSVFTRNERVIAFFEGATTPFAVVLVGALLVGSIETVWAGTITPPSLQRPPWQILGKDHDQPLVLARGVEMARFNMGSTVIVLFPAGAVEWNHHLRAGNRIALGEQIGKLRAALG